MLRAIVLMMVMFITSIPGSKAAALGGEEGQRATMALFEAVQANDFAAVQSSVAAGANPRAPNHLGLTAIDVAIDRGYFRVAHYLVAVIPPGAPVAAAPRPIPNGGSGRSAVKEQPTSSPPALSEPLPAPSHGLARGTGRGRTTAAGGQTLPLPEAFDPAKPAYGARIIPADQGAL